MIFKLLFIFLFANDINHAIESSAIRHGIDPKLALSIAKVESRLDPCKIGGMGEYGLFQLRPEFHKVKLCEVNSNIETAMKYLVYLKKRCYNRYGEAWFICLSLWYVC